MAGPISMSRVHKRIDSRSDRPLRSSAARRAPRPALRAITEAKTSTRSPSDLPPPMRKSMTPTPTPPVAGDVRAAIAGALFDFLGFLTTHDRRWTFSSRDDAAPAVKALEEWAGKRRLSLDEADVSGWSSALSAASAAEPQGWIDVDQLPPSQTPVLLDIGGKYPIRAMWVEAKT